MGRLPYAASSSKHSKKLCMDRKWRMLFNVKCVLIQPKDHEVDTTGCAGGLLLMSACRCGEDTL